jgi:hypothetical protein
MTYQNRQYTAEIGGSSWSKGPKVEFATIREARAWAEEYGTTADYCLIYNSKGRLVASHRRDQNGNGQNWFRAMI